MNASQVHLALTHMPVILGLTGLAILTVSLFIKKPVITNIAYWILLAAGLFAVPVFFTGEGAEEISEHLPGVSESIVSKHEELAKFSFYAALLVAAGALIGLFPWKKSLLRVVYYFVLIASIITTGLMIQTAHLGGQIRHTEIRQGALASETNHQNETDGKEEEEEDD